MPQTAALQALKVPPALTLITCAKRSGVRASHTLARSRTAALQKSAPGRKRTMALSRARESATSSGCDSTDPCISVIEVSTFCTLRHIAAGESDAPTSRRKVNRRRRAESRSAACNEQCSPHVAPLASGQKLLVMLGKEFKEFGGIVDYLMMHRHFAVVKKVPLLAQQLESRQTRV
jgi:hypothetical protein